MGSNVTTNSDRQENDPRVRRWQGRALDFLSGYFWLIFKNVMGWILILASLPVGLTFPGPGGFPIFLIGFALVTFPGKRKLTSRVMRGRGLPIETEIFTFLTAFFAIIVTCVGMWFLSSWVNGLLMKVNANTQPQKATYWAMIAWLLVTGLFSLGTTWIVMRLSLRVVNYVLRGMPFLRRKFRPWLRRHGLNLLPSRHKGSGDASADGNEEILEIHERYRHGLISFRNGLWHWGKRAIYVGVTVAIFAAILKPLGMHWSEIIQRILPAPTPADVPPAQDVVADRPS